MHDCHKQELEVWARPGWNNCGVYGMVYCYRWVMACNARPHQLKPSYDNYVSRTKVDWNQFQHCCIKVWLFKWATLVFQVIVWMILYDDSCNQVEFCATNRKLGKHVFVCLSNEYLFQTYELHMLIQTGILCNVFYSNVVYSELLQSWFN